MKVIPIFIIRMYQGLLYFKQSLLMSVFGYQSVCKHRPTCSQYTVNQIKNSGTISGLCQGFLRIVSCW